jgi:type VI secretion system secreted protein Hcp
MAEMFLKLTDITGESLDADHQDEIEVHGWNWGLSNDASFSIRTMREGAPHTSVQHLTIDKALDNASVPLTQYCAQGTHISQGVLVCRKHTGDRADKGRKPHQDEYLKIELTDIKVLSVKWPSGRGMEAHVPEIIELEFLEFNMTYKMQAQEGQLTGARHFHFSIPEQKVK